MLAGKTKGYEVITGFIDGKTSTAYNVGDIYECTKKRFDEIQKKGNYLRVIEQPETDKKGE